MTTCIRTSDQKEYEFLYWTGTDMWAASDLFAKESIRFLMFKILENGTLEIKVNATGENFTYHVPKQTYLVNKNGKPAIYHREDFYEKFNVRVASKDEFMKEFFEGAGVSPEVALEGSESQTSVLWDDANNLLDIREALNDYLDEEVGVCGKNCNCKEKKYLANSNIKTAMVYPITADFDVNKFSVFIGEFNTFDVTYRYTGKGKRFMGVSVQTQGLFATNITPGDSIIKLESGRLIHASATHTNS
jgi:hypothetical protein